MSPLASLVASHAPQLAHARPAQRAAIIREIARQSGVAVQTVYAALARAGASPKRARRSDAGTTCIPEAVIERAARLYLGARNKRGRNNMPMREVYELLVQEGLLPDVSYEQLCRVMERAGYSVRALNAPAPGIARVSSYPNHIWMIDVSICAQWYLDTDGSVRQLANAEAVYNLNKLGNLAQLASKPSLHRYVCIDHHTQCYYVRYYLSGGENAADMVDFLWHCMRRKEAHPMHGLPKRIVWDQGPANKAQEVAMLCSKEYGLDIELEWHGAGNAKATGGVEARHNHWQNRFEGRTHVQRPASLAQLNEWAEAEATRMTIERKVERNGASWAPAVMWASITPDQLREAPSRRVFFALATSSWMERTVDGYLRISVDAQRWQLSGQNLYRGQKVQVRLVPFADGEISGEGIQVMDAHGQRLTAERLVFNQVGLPENGRRAVWHAEGEQSAGAAPPPAVARTLTREVKDGAVAQADDLMMSLAAAAERSRFLQRAGTPYGGREIAEPPMSQLDVLDAVRAHYDRRLTAEEARHWTARAEAGLTLSQLRAALLELATAPVAQLA